MSDIYTIEKRIDDIIKFLEERLESTTTLYVPTRHRFESWIEKFNTAIKLTTRIIQEDDLQDDEEFDNNPSVNVEQICDTLYQLADRYEEILTQTTISTTLSSSLSTVAFTSNNTNNTNNTNRTTNQLSIDEKKEVIYQYRACINQLVEKVDLSNINYLKECAYTIKQWFDARYKVGRTDFKYDVKTLPTWILGIVITYSHHVLTNTTQNFILDFFDWIDNIDENATYSVYPVPYNIYMNTKSVCVDDAFLTSIVLWDLLYDNGFYQLQSCKVPLKQDGMKSFYVKNSTDSVTNDKNYKYYKDDDSILYTSKLLINDKDKDNE